MLLDVNYTLLKAQHLDIQDNWLSHTLIQVFISFNALKIYYVFAKLVDFQLSFTLKFSQKILFFGRYLLSFSSMSIKYNTLHGCFG